MRYVERNPVRAKVVRRAWSYAWSSAAAHCGGKDGKDASGLLDLRAWRKMLAGGDWRAELTQRDDVDAVSGLRRCTGRGRPLGSDSFVSKMEKLMGRRLRALPVGRPRKKRGKK